MNPYNRYLGNVSINVYYIFQGFPYTSDLIRKEAAIDIPPLLRGAVWACLLDVIPNGSYEKIDKFTPTSTDRQVRQSNLLENVGSLV